MSTHEIVAREEWLARRRSHLAREKELTRLRDELARERRALPWVRVERAYRFDTEAGPRALGDLFGRASQLLVYHFMFGPDWVDPCKSCSFWADNYDRITVHLAARDVSLVAVSRAPLARLRETKRRFGWSFEWVSSPEGDFGRDFGVYFDAAALASGEKLYNYGSQRFGMSDAPGISVFARDAGGAVFHTYSCYARGLDMLNGAYHLLDLVPKGRDEAGLPHTMAWLRHRDRYAS
jgi:predicted dithiol-disulfide oxidoreductase (DUF899 family)